MLLPNLAVAVRRLRDAGHDWPNLFWILVPIAGLIVLVIYWTQPSLGVTEVAEAPSRRRPPEGASRALLYPAARSRARSSGSALQRPCGSRVGSMGLTTSAGDFDRIRLGRRCRSTRRWRYQPVCRTITTYLPPLVVITQVVTPTEEDPVGEVGAAAVAVPMVDVVGLGPGWGSRAVGIHAPSVPHGQRSLLLLGEQALVTTEVEDGAGVVESDRQVARAESGVECR